MRAIPTAFLLLSVALDGPAAAEPADMPSSPPANLAAVAYGGSARTHRVTAIDDAGQRSSTSGEPSAPAGLRGDVYSRTAAEIFWERPKTAGLTYEVARDGQSLTTTDGTSYFDDRLSAGQSYLYEVTTVDAAGRRSETSALMLTTLGGPGDPVGPMEPPAASGPAAPDGLRSVVYSATAGAIAWDRPSTNGLSYEISRDRQVVATTNGTSYVDQSLTGGQSYPYAVVAVDLRGRRSDAATVSLVTPAGEPSEPDPPASSGTIISVENRNDVLANVLAVISGEVYRPDFTLVDDTLLGEAGKTLVSEERGPDGESVFVFDCEGGGRLESTFSDRVRTTTNDIVVEDCRLGGVLFNGTVETGRVRDSASSTADLTIRKPSGEVVLLASDRREDSRTLYEGRDFNVTRYRSRGPEGRVSIRRALSEVRRDRPFDLDSSENASFFARVNAPWTGGEVLVLRGGFGISNPPGLRANDETYSRGDLVVEAADGSRLVLDANGGDPGSLTLTIEADGGASSFTLSVGEGAQIPCLGTPEEGIERAILTCQLVLGDDFFGRRTVALPSDGERSGR